MLRNRCELLRIPSAGMRSLVLLAVLASYIVATLLAKLASSLDPRIAVLLGNPAIQSSGIYVSLDGGSGANLTCKTARFTP